MKATKSDTYKTRIYLTGTFNDVIEYIHDLRLNYPGDKYEIVSDSDGELWIQDVELLEKIEQAQIKAQKAADVKAEKALLKKLRSKYG